MTDLALIERITRSLAFMLRHQPETFDLELDPFGYADLEDVVHALNERLGEPVEEEDVREAVGAGDRPRYEIQGDRIRALYGHSIPVDPGPSSKPPEFLYVAVPEQELERARRFGLRGGRRRFLHLAATKEDAAESGRRASRDYTVLLIHALDAWEEGISFYDRIALWLAEEVPTNLLEVEGTYHDGTDPLPRRFDGPRERERGHERQGHGGGHGGGGHGGGQGGRHGRRGGRGRGRDRDRGEFRENRGGERPVEAREQSRETSREPSREPMREPAREPAREPSLGHGEVRARRPEGDFERGRRDERPPREARESFGSAPAERGGDRGRDRGDQRPRHEGRGDGREPRTDSRPEYRPETREARPESRPDSRHEPRHEPRQEGRRDERPERREGRPEGRPEGQREERRGDARPERNDDRRGPPREERRPESREPRERTPEPASRSAAPARGSGGGGGPGGFGAGIEHGEESRARQERSAPPPPPRPAPPPREERPAGNSGPGFGAGL